MKNWYNKRKTVKIRNISEEINLKKTELGFKNVAMKLKVNF